MAYNPTIHTGAPLSYVPGQTHPIDLAGRTFGRWRVLEYAGKQRWRCQCACGTERVVTAVSLRHGKSRGCAKCQKRGKRTHGERATRLYGIWQGIKNRCGNHRVEAFPRYGGRGIRVCAEWLNDFVAFRDWARASGYADSLTIERRDVNGNYEPDNCCWIPAAAQAKNTRAVRLVEFNGRVDTIHAHALKCGIKPTTAISRIHFYGWPVEKALTTPARPWGR